MPNPVQPSIRIFGAADITPTLVGSSAEGIRSAANKTSEPVGTLTEIHEATDRALNPDDNPDDASTEERRGATNNVGTSTAETGKKIPKIPELFEGKYVLVTGATGFLGKVLVEKLLRSCPGIVELYILVRQSETFDSYQRVIEYIAQPVFDRLRLENANALSKVACLIGDVTKDNLGLSFYDFRKVITNVSFVFHCAADVRFDDQARNILSTNLIGVHNVLEMCRKCELLQALVHVSTAYSFCNNFIIYERVYPEMVTPADMIENTKWREEEELRNICMACLQNRPALYHFSKAMAETLIVETKLKFPAIIVRPSIITASLAEPYPGWIDNYNGPSGFIGVCGKGIVRTLYVKPKVIADWVPVDIVANTLIAAAHYIALEGKFEGSENFMRRENYMINQERKVPIINCTCPEDKHITWMQVVNYCLPFLREYPPTQVYGKPGGIVTPHIFIYYMCRLFSHYLPAFLIDALSLLMLRKPRMICLYNRIHRVMSYLEYYTTRSFNFRSTNMRRLIEWMQPEDIEVFPIDQRRMIWISYIENYVLGVRRYFTQEDDSTLPYARKRMMRFHYGWMVLKVSSWFGIFWMIQSLHKRGFFQNSFLLTSTAFTNVFNRRVMSNILAVKNPT